MVIGTLYLGPFSGIAFLWFVAVIRDQLSNGIPVIVEAHLIPGDQPGESFGHGVADLPLLVLTHDASLFHDHARRQPAGGPSSRCSQD